MSSVALLEWSYLPANLIGSEQQFEALGASFVIQNGSARAQMDESTFRSAPDMTQKLLAVIKARVAPLEHTEFKREAAGHLPDQGYSHIEASRSLGVVELLCEAFEVPAHNLVWWGDTTYPSSAGCPLNKRNT
ncbi:hypothetical protein ACTACG_08050 [Pseudomonas syringae]|uniref:hypothetical protein n=1 Tax=Pseudomonas syringae TaxID=317 RepID=UPI003F75685F